ncbi:hypothetical protein M758_10G076000 [Ceratodon purpureus]|nr:hypothetical protein M758_10G076000 [Ceratodon purpureus]
MSLHIIIKPIRTTLQTQNQHRQKTLHRGYPNLATPHPTSEICRNVGAKRPGQTRTGTCWSVFCNPGNAVSDGDNPKTLTQVHCSTVISDTARWSHPMSWNESHTLNGGWNQPLAGIAGCVSDDETQSLFFSLNSWQDINHTMKMKSFTI